MKCELVPQGVPQGSCLTQTSSNEFQRACEVTLRSDTQYTRLIKSIHLSRPEDYLSVYQSGCNHSCLKCHSSEFSKFVMGEWISTDDLALLAELYSSQVTVVEPRSRATMWHAEDLCLHCGSCVVNGKPSKFCPNKLSREQIVLSPQGLGPARNIIAFTGGDLTCQPYYYAEAARKIKEASANKLLVLVETNGYALTRKNLEILRDGGVDSYWLDIKAFDEQEYRKLCGTPNSTVINSLELIVELGFTVEVLTLFIPSIVETDQHQQIARLICDIDSSIPTTLLAFFPTYKLNHLRSPTFDEMIRSYDSMKGEGLKHIRLGNIGVFTKTDVQREKIYALRANDG